MTTDLVPFVTTLARAEVLTLTSLDLVDDLPYQSWEQLMAALGSIKRGSSWWVGDGVLYGEHSYGEAYAQAADATGLSPDTIRNYAWVCSRIAPSRRLADVPFSVHECVAAMSPREQRRWLSIARRERLTQREMRQRIRDEAEALGRNGGETSASLPGHDATRPSAEGEGTRRDREAGNGRSETSATSAEALRGTTTPSGLPTLYAVPGAPLRRLARDLEAAQARNGYVRVEVALIERIVAVVND